MEKFGGFPFLLARLPKPSNDIVQPERLELCIAAFECMGEILKNAYGMEQILQTSQWV